MDARQRVKYSELVDIEKLRALMESFSQALGIANAVIDVDGSVITSAGWQRACTDFHRVDARTCRRCIESDTTLAERMAVGTPFAVYRCLNGLVDNAASIVVNGEHVANVFTGQFLTEPPDVGFFRAQARQFGFDETAYLEAISQVPVLSQERVESITRLYARLAGMLADHGMDRLRQKEALANMTALNERLEEKVALRTEALRENVEAHLSILEASIDGFWRIDEQGCLVDVNPAYCRQSGYTREELLQMRISDLEAEESPADVAAHMQRVRATGCDLFESRHRRKDGSIWHVEVSATCRDVGGGQYFAFLRDISERKRAEGRLHQIAHYDPLTSLPNRSLLADRLRQAMAQAQRRAQLLAVVFLDLDGFKSINDLHGHEAGDQLLIALAARMKATLRQGDTLARIGGDEFIAVLPDLSDVAASVPRVARLLAAAAKPVHVGKLTLQVSASAGISSYPQTEDVDGDQLLRQSDVAMYQAKVAGKGRYHVFDARKDGSNPGYHDSLEDIGQALGRREFVLHYQPKVNMRTGQVIGVEALIRWQHPAKGLLAPSVFLPMIEDHPLSVDVGHWVFDEALTQMERWQVAGLDIAVSVNLGARQLQQPDFVDGLRRLLAGHPSIAPGRLELELRETNALDDVVRVSEVIEACRKIGVLFVLDDFGTGYSSLAFLKRLAVPLLKIDQSLVRDMLEDPDDLAVVEGLLGLATAFRRNVIAEGVESIEHGELLLQLGCELAQGYRIARPMPAEHLPQWVATWRPHAAWSDATPLSADDRPLLFAGAEHRAWVHAIEKHLAGEIDAPPPLDHAQCRFGTWLHADARARYGMHAAFQSIDRLHRGIHTAAAALLKLHSRGRDAEALSRLNELHRLRDTLLGQLNALARERQ